MAVDTHIPWYREPKKLGAVIQIAMFAAVAIVVYVMAQNAQSNMDARGITMNTWFLDSEAPFKVCLLYTSPSPRDLSTSRMPSSA